MVYGLYERHQHMVIMGHQSEEGIIKADVPKWSVLGPFLFLVYINYLTFIIQMKMKLFANDTSLYIEFDHANSPSESLNDDLINIQQCTEKWLVKFGSSKTKLMTCTYRI